MIHITDSISIALSEVRFTFIASPGPGGQHVNKTATAAQLRFNVLHSRSLPEDVRARLISMLGKRISAEGELIIKASNHRTQLRNKQEAFDRLCRLIQRVAIRPIKRKKTKPTWQSRQRRLAMKKLHGIKKAQRRDVNE